MSTMKLRPAHFKILIVASLGQFLGQGLATLVGIIIPLLQLCSPYGLPSEIQGVLGCISLIGIMVGSAIIGNLCDRYGYIGLFRICPIICGCSALAVIIFPKTVVLLVALFIMGFAVGGEYSLDPNYISELMPQRWKTFMVGVAKAIASAGSAFVAIVCYFILKHSTNPHIWSSLMWIVVGLCTLMAVSRIGFVQSPLWLAVHGQKQAARKAVKKMLGQDVEIDIQDSTPSMAPAEAHISIWVFIKSHLRKVILTGVPWAFEGLGVYGIGIFLPVLIIAFGIDTAAIDLSHFDRIQHSVGMTFVLCVIMMVGFSIGLIILRKFNHIAMQIWGFVLCVLGLGIVLAAYLLHWPTYIAIAGFAIFELALNAGPHLITFVLPSQEFAVSDRGTGAGIAASVGKAGAVLGAFCIPIILNHWGASGVLILSIIVMALGAIITWLFK